MDNVKLEVEGRDGKGRTSRNKLAREGRIPGVVYGKEMDNMSVAVDSIELEKIVRDFGTSKVIDLKVKGAKEGDLKVMVKELQHDPIRREITHVDFHKINMHDKIKTTARIKLEGEPLGVQKGGTVQQQLWNIEVECLPASIPENITADISSLDLGESLHVSDLTPVEGVEISTDPDTVVASVVVPRAEEPEVEADEVEEAANEGDNEENKEQ